MTLLSRICPGFWNKTSSEFNLSRNKNDSFPAKVLFFQLNLLSDITLLFIIIYSLFDVDVIYLQ